MNYSYLLLLPIAIAIACFVLWNIAACRCLSERGRESREEIEVHLTARHSVKKNRIRLSVVNLSTVRWLSTALDGPEGETMIEISSMRRNAADFCGGR